MAGFKIPDEAVVYQNYDQVQKHEWPWRRYFTPEEMACKDTGALIVVPWFMDELCRLRSLCGFPFIITSAYRTPDHNMRVATTGRAGPHTTGLAVDIKCYGADAVKLDQMATGLRYPWDGGGKAGDRVFTGKGVYQSGYYKNRFIHLDAIRPTEDHEHLRPAIWSGKV